MVNPRARGLFGRVVAMSGTSDSRMPREAARELAEKVAARAEELDRRIDRAAEGWTADRLGVIERNVLRVGIHELERDTVPVEVAINEAVELAKRYASEDAAKLVNGILARVAREETT
jgi:N utilization substance protein B